MAIYNETGVPLLHNLSQESLDYVQGKHQRAVDELEKAAHAVRGKRGALEAGKELPPEAQAQYDAQDKHLLIGDSVIVHNKVPVGGGLIINPDGSAIAHPGAPEYTAISIGASTLHEALTEVIGAFDAHLQSSDHIDPPDWVASTNKDLARLLAEQWDAEVRDIAEVLG